MRLIWSAVILAVAAGCSQAADPARHTAQGAASPAGQAADTIYTGGDIVTVNDQQPSAEAIALKDGTILAVGARADIEKANKGAATNVVDLAGKALLPAFIDAHGHYINSLLVANQCQLYAPPSGPGKDVDSIIAELRKFAESRKIPKGEMIMGYGYDDTVMPDGRLLNRDDLDAAFPDNPVRVDHVSMHGAVMNSLALKKYGISAATKTPAGGVIVRKPGTNEPYGLIMEMAFLPVMRAAGADDHGAGSRVESRRARCSTRRPASPWPTRVRRIWRSCRRSSAPSEAGRQRHRRRRLSRSSPTSTRSSPSSPCPTWGKYDKQFKIGGVKISIDGSPQGRTAAFTTPYLTGGPGGEKNWKGELAAPQDVINKGLKKVYDLGVPVLFHVNGDAAIDSLIKAHEFAAADDLTKYRNVTTIHAQFTRKDHIPKFVEYKIRPSFYTLHTYYFADTHIGIAAREQAMYISPMRDAIDAGLRPDQPHRLRRRPARPAVHDVVGREPRLARRRRDRSGPAGDAARGA